jgi:Protein of unknown function (DUF1091)
LQDCYIQFDKFNLNVNYNVINISYAFKNTPDGEAFDLSFKAQFNKEVLEEQHRIKLCAMDDEKDQQYSRTYMATTVNYCRFLEGVSSNPFARVISENFFQSLSQNYSCPIPKDTIVELKKSMCTDKFMPPMLTESRLRFTNAVFGKIRGKKSWVSMYTIEVFLRLKKTLLRMN